MTSNAFEDKYGHMCNTTRDHSKSNQSRSSSSSKLHKKRSYSDLETSAVDPLLIPYPFLNISWLNNINNTIEPRANVEMPRGYCRAGVSFQSFYKSDDSCEMKVSMQNDVDELNELDEWDISNCNCNTHVDDIRFRVQMLLDRKSACANNCNDNNGYTSDDYVSTD
jgi:hypothetical protein